MNDAVGAAGHPDPGERLDPAVRAAVGALGVDAEVLACDPELADTAAFCAHYGVDPADAANCILVASRREPVRAAACVILATTRLDVNGTVRRRLDAGRVSFASAELTRELTGMLIGGVTPFGLPAGVPVWIDPAVMGRGRVTVGGGNRSSKLRLAPRGLLLVPGAEVVEGLALPPPGAGEGSDGRGQPPVRRAAGPPSRR